MYALDTSVPIPKVRKGRPFKYPFNRMKVGQSFLVPMDKAHSVKVCASYHTRRGLGVYRTRATSKGLRIWRIA